MVKKVSLLLALFFLSACESSDPSSAPPKGAEPQDPPPSSPEGSPVSSAPITMIPITMAALANGDEVPTAQISIGGSAPFAALLDTGSTGLFVAGGVVEDAGWVSVSETPASTAYGSGVSLTGVVAQAALTISGLTATVPAVKVTEVGCVASKPNCSAKGKTPDTFRFGNSFPAILGVGMRGRMNLDLPSPFALLAKTKRYVISLSQHLLFFDPPNDADYTDRIKLPSLGAGSWDDREVPFCANTYCATGLLDTGAGTILNPASAAALGISTTATSVPLGTSITMTVGKSSSWSFTTTAKDRITLADNPIGNVLGILPYYALDILYDYGTGEIRLAPAK